MLATKLDLVAMRKAAEKLKFSGAILASDNLIFLKEAGENPKEGFSRLEGGSTFRADGEFSGNKFHLLFSEADNIARVIIYNSGLNMTLDLEEGRSVSLHFQGLALSDPIFPAIFLDNRISFERKGSLTEVKLSHGMLPNVSLTELQHTARNEGNYEKLSEYFHKMRDQAEDLWDSCWNDFNAADPTYLEGVLKDFEYFNTPTFNPKESNNA